MLQELLPQILNNFRCKSYGSQCLQSKRRSRHQNPWLFSWEPNLHCKEKMRFQIMRKRLMLDWVFGEVTVFPPEETKSMIFIQCYTSAPHLPLTQPVLARIWATHLWGCLWGRGLEATGYSVKYSQIELRNQRPLILCQVCAREWPGGAADTTVVCHRDLSDDLEHFWHGPSQFNHSGSCNISPSEKDPSETSSQGNGACAKRRLFFKEGGL